MRLAVDTNVLVRAVVRDDVRQGDIAAAVLAEAELIAIALPVLCELVWVLRNTYGFPAADIAAAIRALQSAVNVEMNRPAVDLGLAILVQGGDFADGVIAFESQWLGGETFVSFDRKAVELLHKQGLQTRLL